MNRCRVVDFRSSEKRSVPHLFFRLFIKFFNFNYPRDIYLRLMEMIC